MSPGERQKLEALEAEILAIARILINQQARHREEAINAGSALVACTTILRDLKSSGAS
jgi:hypothetical protein